MNLKKILAIDAASSSHWVGDAFHVQSVLSYNSPKAKMLNPFILLDYAAPSRFEPTHRPRGVGMHPHRGFETVTIAFQGEVTHKDTHGNGGTIHAGDVQWMTAGSGLMHAEKHSDEFTKIGGTLEMLQLWINLPAKHKMTTPKYQGVTKEDIVSAPIPGDAGTVRVIAGEYEGRRGPASTYTPIQLWDVNVKDGKTASFSFPSGWTGAILVRRSGIEVNGRKATTSQLVTFDKNGGDGDINVTGVGNASFVLMMGEPIEEPIVGYGPFVMNRQSEISQAFNDFQAGKFGIPDDDDD